MKITVKLKCKCTDGEISLEVPARELDEAIEDYMPRLQTYIGYWHVRRGCSETALEYLKIYIEPGKGIGEAPDVAS